MAGTQADWTKLQNAGMWIITGGLNTTPIRFLEAITRLASSLRHEAPDPT